MRWSVFIVLQGLILSALFGVYYIHRDRVITLKKPPESIAQWYKPQNKRQIWLHTMFKLRREMQAVGTYATAQDAGNLQKWAAKLNEDYRKIPEMVPEWDKRLNITALDAMQSSAQEDRYSDVTRALEELAENCKSCHTDFRAVTAALYRAPDFSGMKVKGSTELTSHMRSLSEHVNQIKIGFVDDRPEAALVALADLRTEMRELGETCSTCHKNASQTYPGEDIIQATDNLEQSLNAGSLQDKGRALGTLAVMACAQCHGTHRLAYDTKILLGKKKSLRESLKHSY